MLDLMGIYLGLIEPSSMSMRDQNSLLPMTILLRGAPTPNLYEFILMRDQYTVSAPLSSEARVWLHCLSLCW